MRDREDELRSASVLAATVKGAAGGLISALALGAAVALILGGPGFGQAVSAQSEPAPAIADAREECESGARAPDGDARALGACDLLLRSGGLGEEARARVLINRAVNLVRRGNARAALTDLDAAGELLPQSGAVELNRAAALILAGDFSRAEDAARRALDLGVDAPELAWLNLAIALERQDRFDAAYQAYLEAAALAPENALLQAQPARFLQHRPAG